MWKQVKSVIMKNQLTYIVDNLRMSTFSVNVHFWVNYSFKEVSHSTSFALFEAFFLYKYKWPYTKVKSRMNSLSGLFCCGVIQISH